MIFSNLSSYFLTHFEAVFIIKCTKVTTIFIQIFMKVEDLLEMLSKWKISANFREITVGQRSSFANDRLQNSKCNTFIEKIKCCSMLKHLDIDVRKFHTMAL